MNEAEANEIRTKALAKQNPPGTTWRDFISARFIGRIPDNICEAPAMLVIHNTLATPKSDTEATVSGFFEYSTDPHAAQLGGLDGVINLVTRQFTFSDRSPTDPWTFSGTISPNGRVWEVALVFEDGYTSDTFSLIHEDTFGEFMPQ